MNPVVAVLLALPCVAWIFVARSRRIGWIVGLVLFGWIGLVMGIVAVFPRARAEITLVYLPVAVAVIWIGRRLERRQLGLPERASGVWAVRILLAVTTVITCVCGPLVFFAFNEDPFMPSADELLPLPRGIHATEMTGDHAYSCGTGSCTRRFTVTGRPGQPASEVRDVVSRHLRGRGWKLDAGGQDCHGAGWLLDRTTICVGVYVHDGVVYVAFEGARAWA